MLYFIILYMGIITSTPVAFSVCALLISLMESVSGRQFLKITSLLLIFGFVGDDGAGAIVIVQFTGIYVVSAVFWIALFGAVLSASGADG